MFFKHQAPKITRLKLAILLTFAVGALFVGSSSLSPRYVLAKPAFMDRYDRDPYALEKFKGHCTLCHIGHGGGERNDFGEAFEDAGYRFTTKLRKDYPQYFTAEQ